MDIADRAAFETFLVEDVILTLSNLRAVLGWVGAGEEERRAGIARLEFQIDLLEERARAMCRTLGEPAAPDEGNLFAGLDDGGATPALPSFRSRRSAAA